MGKRGGSERREGRDDQPSLKQDEIGEGKLEKE